MPPVTTFARPIALAVCAVALTPPAAAGEPAADAPPAAERPATAEGVTLLGPAPPAARRDPLPPGVTLTGGAAPERAERVVVRVSPEPPERDETTIGPGREEQTAAFEGTLTEAGTPLPPWSEWVPEEALDRTAVELPYPWNVVEWSPLPSWFEWVPGDDLPHTSIEAPYPWQPAVWAETGIPWRWEPSAAGP